MTIGILPGNDIGDANPYVDIPIATGIGYARNVIIVKTARCLIAINGKYGTLSEIAYSLAFNKPIVGIKTPPVEGNIKNARSADEAVEIAFSLISGL